MGRIQTKKAECTKCQDGILKPCIGKGDKALCNYHYWAKHQRSKKEEQRQTKYRPIAQSFKLANDSCQIQIPDVCVIRPVSVHHPEGRIGNKLFEDDKFISGCDPCHRFVEEHPAYAIENNFSNKRLNK